MSASVGVVFLVVLALSVGSAVLLYVLVREETDNRPVMDRDAAERTARRDASDDE
jgi:hypothetical protein